MSKFTAALKTSTATPAQVLEDKTGPEGDNGPQVTVSTFEEATKIMADAIDTAAKLSDATNSEVEALVVSMEVVKRGALDALFRLRADFGDKLLSLPVPGSDASMTNGRPDKFKYRVKNEKNEDVTKQGSWWNTFADHTTVGKAVVEELSAIMSKSADYANMGAADLERITKQVRNRQTYVRSLFKKAYQIERQINGINDLPHVEIEIASDNDSTTPFTVLSTVAGEKGKFLNLTVPNLLQIDVSAAKADGGTFKAISSQLVREPNTGDAKKTANKNAVTIDSREKLLNALVSIEQYLDPSNSDGAYNTIMKELGKASGNEEMILAIGDLAATAEGLVSKVERRYQDLAAKRAQEAGNV